MMADDSVRNAELDGRIADAIQKNIQEIARAVMDEHDTAYPESKLRSIPHEERRLWVEQNLSFIVGSIRENRTNENRPAVLYGWPASFMVPPIGFEPTALGLGNRCSIP